MKRSSIRRKPRPKKVWAEVESTRLFRQAAAAQVVCASCGRGDMVIETDARTGKTKRVRLNWDAHHVIERSFLKREGLEQFDTRNALRLCEDCHGKHTNRSKKLKLTMLTIDNIVYAVSLLGPDRADLVLRRWYEGEDDRLENACAAVS